MRPSGLDEQRLGYPLLDDRPLASRSSAPTELEPPSWLSCVVTTGKVRRVVEPHVAGGAGAVGAGFVSGDQVQELVSSGAEGRGSASARGYSATITEASTPWVRFNVAVTRARHGVLLLAPPSLESPCIAELLKDGHASPTPQRAKPASATRKPWSARPAGLAGLAGLVTRSGPGGRFLGCSAFPRCRHTTPLH